MGNSEKKPLVPGIFPQYKPDFSPEETARLIHESHERRFSTNQKTDGTRHGNGFIPIEHEDFFEDIHTS